MDYSYGQTYSFVDTPVTHVTKFMYMLCNKANVENVLSHIESNPFEMNAYAKGGMTPLMLLSKYSNDAYYYTVFDKILPLVDVDIKDSSNNTALMYATTALGKTSSIEAVKKLVSHGANWNQQCYDNVTPLMYLGANTSSDILITFLNDNTMDVDKRDNNNNSFATIVTQRLVSSEPDENLKNIVKSMLTRANLYLPVNDTKRNIVMTLATNDTYFDLLTSICENDVANDFAQHVNDVDKDGNNVMILTVKHFKNHKNISRFNEIVSKKYEKIDFESLANVRGETYKFLVESHETKQLKEMIYPQIKARLPMLAGCPICKFHKKEYVTSRLCGHSMCLGCYIKVSQMNEGKATLICPIGRCGDFKEIDKHVASNVIAAKIDAIREEYNENDYDDDKESSSEESEPSDTSDEEDV